jgi:hypothetical protein
MTSRIVFYDAQQFRPVPHRVRLHKPGEDRHWNAQGWWPVGLDWRPGAPTFLSNLSLTLLYRRLQKVFDLHRQRDPESFQLRITPLDEDGDELPEQSYFFVPTSPIDDEDPEEYRRWISAASAA